MQTDRIKNSFYNGASNIFVNISSTIFSFIVRTFFIRILGEECLGLDGLFTNILSLLSLAELGFSTAISFSLYKPLANHDTSKITALMMYFKRIYYRIAFIVLTLGIILMVFLNSIIGNIDINYNIYIIYIIYLISAVSSYFISYTSILIEADQKNYLLTKIRFLFDLITYGMQLVVLLIFRDFILYILIQFITRLIQRIVTNSFIVKKYNSIDFHCKSDINQSEKKEIKKNIVGLVYHRVGDYAVNGTDNILISTLVNISTTGFYSNYLSITSACKGILGCLTNAVTSSLGNLNATEGPKVKKNVFETINFFNYFLAGVITLGLFFCIDKFIVIWIGSKYVLPFACKLVICINLYLYCISLPIIAMKNSAGIYYIDRYIPIIQAIINLTVSIVLGIYFGLIGILLGTAISSIFTVNSLKPIVIYKHVFKSNSLSYFKSLILQVILVLSSGYLTYFLLEYIKLSSVLALIISGLVSVVLYTLLFIICFHNNKFFKYYKDLFLESLKKLTKRKRLS